MSMRLYFYAIYNSNLNDRSNRLVIAHGLLEENVHFVHTSKLIDALVLANKPYILKVSIEDFMIFASKVHQIFPKERHGLRKQESSSYFYHFVCQFLKENL